MTRIPFPDLAQAPADVRAGADQIPYAVVRMIAHATGSFLPWMAFNGSLIGPPSTVDPLIREFGICRAGALSSEYEFVHHANSARRLGASEAQLDAVRAGTFDRPLFSDEQGSALRFIDEVIRNVRASDEALADLKRHFTDRQVIEFILVVSCYMMNSRVAANTDVTFEDDAFLQRRPEG